MADQLGQGQEPQPTTNSYLGAGLLVFILALSVRLYILSGLSENPSFLYPLIDAGAHHKLALEIQSSNEIPAKLFWRSVFYPVYLSAIYFVTGSSILAAKLLQAGLGAVTCLLTYQLGRRYFGPACGLVAGSITALYGPLIFWESELLAVGWAAFWSLTLLWIAAKAERGGSAGSHFAFGLVGGAAVLTRPSFLPFVLLAGVWLAWSSRRAIGRRALLRPALLVTGFFLLTVPSALTSRAVADHASFLPKAGSLNLYIGNHPQRCDMLAARPGTEWRDLRSIDESWPTGGPRAFRDSVVDQAMAEPLAFAEGIIHKANQFANGREIPRNTDIYLFREWAPLLRPLVWKLGSFGFPFGVLFPMAALGLILRRRDIPKPLLLLAATYPLAIVATFVAGRYRVPLVPALSILAAAGAVEIHSRLRSGHLRSALAPLALGAALLVLTNRADPYCEESGSFHAEMYSFVAMDAEAAGNTDLALELLEKAVQVDPDSPRAHEELATFYAGQNELDLALDHYDRAILLSEQYWVYRARAVLHFTRMELDLAMEDFNRALALNPRYSPAYVGRARAHRRRGELRKARFDLERALKHARTKLEAGAAQAVLNHMNKRRP